MAEIDYRRPIERRPRQQRDWEILFVLPKRMVETHDERALCMKLVANRRLFGLCYRALMPRYQDVMRPGNGVLIRGFVPTREIVTDLVFPGDIDLLVLPYRREPARTFEGTRD